MIAEHFMTYPSSNQQKAYPPNIDKYFADDNDAGRLLAESDVNSNITRYYIYGTGLLAAVTPEGQTYCYHYNGIGSTIAITDSNQAIINKYSYDAFGTIANQQETIAQPFKYVGQAGVMTEPNGFYYMKARYYDPQVGRFISEDPTGFDGGDVNLMAYVGNNPVNRIDPEGLWNNGVHGPSNTQFVDDKYATGPFSLSGYKYHWNVDRNWAISGMKNAITLTEYLTYKHAWQDSYCLAQKNPILHAMLWIPYILTFGMTETLNPDSKYAFYNRAAYAQMQLDSKNLPAPPSGGNNPTYENSGK